MKKLNSISHIKINKTSTGLTKMEIIIKKKDGDTKLTFVNKCVSIIKYVFISNSLALFIIIIIILLLLLLIQTF
jgi:hypothetical protein